MDSIKGSRRKQTKPNRVPFGMDPHPHPHPHPPPPSGSPLGRPHHPHAAEDVAGLAYREAGEGDVPMDMSVSSCRSSSADLQDHMEMVHGADPQRSREVDDPFPTAYHRLGSQLVQENSPVLPPPSSSMPEPQDQALSLTRTPPQGGDTDGPADAYSEPKEEGRSFKVNGGRIFHPDAYCELCDREFCNKYFLKTHRATKHGIYDSRDSPPMPPTPSQVSRQPSEPSEAPLSSPPRMDPPPSTWQQQTPPQYPPPPKEPREEKAEDCKKREEQAAEERVTSVISAVKNSLQSSRPPAAKTSGSSGSKEPTAEDYCEFCQKHFCNKYYLKKHKQDVHGIIPETGPTPTKRSRGGSSSNSMLDLPSSAMGSPMLLPPPLASLGAGLAGLPHGMMMLNPFMPQMSLMPPGSMPQSLLHPQQLLPPPLSPGGSQGLPMPGSGRRPTTPSPHMSGASPRSDTVCSLCKKEFSNVYFLKIHQAHKHGIQSEDVDHEARLLGDMVESSGVVLRPSPPPPSRGEGKQEEGDPARPSPPPLTSATLCQLCNREFPSVRTLKVHQVTEHGKRFDLALHEQYDSGFYKDDGRAAGTPFSRRPGYGGYGMSAAGGGERPSSLSDRVTCDLKLDKMKVHGIGMDEAADRPSSSGEHTQRRSPGSKEEAAQPLNMTMGARPGPPPLMLPTSDMMDFREYNRDINAMEKAAYKSFTDVPSILSETINNEYGFRRSQMQAPPFPGLDLGLRGPPTTAVLNKMDVEQLVREGIDPEAYCNICKKELCSKYFLRTHMEKTHGIKMDIPPSNHSRGKPGPKPTSLAKVGSLREDPLRPVFPVSAMPPGFPPALMPTVDGAIRGGNGGAGGFNQGRSSFEKSHFRWKAPNSATARVTCDICHKEVCNKYFLRTHKLKKHGVAPSDSTPSSDSATASSQSSPASAPASRPDNFLDKGTAMLPRSEAFPIPYSIPLPPTDRPAPRVEDQKQQQQQQHQQQQQQQQHKVSRSEHERVGPADRYSGGVAPADRYSGGVAPADRYSGGDGAAMERVTCHKCDRQFTNKQWLAAHLLRDHGEPGAPHEPEQDQQRHLFPPHLPTMAEAGLGQEPTTCPICRLVLPSLISMQLHLVHKHNAHVKLQMGDTLYEEERSTPLSAAARSLGLKTARVWKPRARAQGERKMKMFVCSYGDYRTHWLYKLQAHEESVHGIATNGRKKKPRSDRAPAPGGQETVDGGGPLSSPRQFKCGLCPARFETHSFCQAHLREKHIHTLRDFVSRKRRRETDSRLCCRFCSYTTSFPFRLHSHVSRVHSSGHCLQDDRAKNFTDLANMVSSETPPDSVHGSPDHSALEEGEEGESPFDLSMSSRAQGPVKQALRMTAEESNDDWQVSARRV